jgi:hypothetical protein
MATKFHIEVVDELLTISSSLKITFFLHFLVGNVRSLSWAGKGKGIKERLI